MLAPPPTGNGYASADAAALAKPDLWLAAVAAAAALVFITVGIRSPLWVDDANAQLMARHGLAGLFAALRNDNNFPAYYVLLGFWMRVFGDSEPALRSLAGLFYLAGAGATFLLARSVYGNLRVALYAAVFYVASAQAIQQAQAVRMYSMLAFLTAISIWLLWRIFMVRRGGVGSTALYMAVQAVGLLTQVWFCFVLLAEFLVVRGQWRKFLAVATPPVLLFALLWGPSLLAQLHNGSTHWLPPFQLWFAADSLLGLYGQPLGGLNLVLGIVVVAACAISWKPCEALAWWRESATRILFGMLAVTIVTPLAVSMLKPIYYPGRYSIISLPVMAVLLGAMAARLTSRRCATAFVFLLLVPTLFWRIGDFTPDNDRTTAAYLVQHAHAGDVVVFTSLTRAPADYYLQHWGAEGRFVEQSFPAEADRHPGWLDSTALLRRPDALEKEAAQLATQLDGFAAHGRRIWLYYGGHQVVSDFLKRKLDARLALQARYDLRGPFHKQLLVYTR
jgi:mannosyltransferase